MTKIVIPTFNRQADRHKPMWATVSYKRVPTFRALAYVMDFGERHGAPIQLLSSDRRDEIIEAHNRIFGTVLHGQDFLYRNQSAPGFLPANSPDTTSHCLKADGTQVRLLGQRGVKTHVRGDIPKYALALDVIDKGKVNDASHFVAVLKKAGFDAELSYPNSGGSERHHVQLFSSPVPLLEKLDIISEDRHS